MRSTASVFLFVILTSLFHPVQMHDRTEKMNRSSLSHSADGAPLINWSQAKEYNGVAYFLLPSNKSLQRYNMSSRAWMPVITFRETPNVFDVDGSGIYVGFGQALSRFNLAGTDEFQFIPCGSTIGDIILFNQFLYVFPQNSEWLSLNKQTGSLVDTMIPDVWGFGFRLLPGKAMIIGKSSSSYGWISIHLNPDGTFGDEFSRDYFVDSLRGETFVLPNQNRIMDGSGHIFFASDLTYSKNILDRIDDVAVYGNQYMVARKGGITGYDSNDRMLGEYYPLKPAQKIFVYGSMIFSFFSRPDGMDVTPLPVSIISLTGQQDIVDPAQMAFWPDTVAMGKDETLYLLHLPSLNIFRWSVPQRKYLSNISLSEPPQNMAYADLTNRLYLSYASGKITQIPLDTSLQEQPFASTPPHSTGFGLIACDEYVVAVSIGSNWLAHYVFNAQGTQVALKDWRVQSHDYVWNSVNRRLYYLQEDTNPRYIQSEEIDSAGQLKNEITNSEVISYQPRLWVKTDGSVLVTGAGRQYDAKTLQLYQGSFASPVLGAAWSGGNFFTVTPQATGSDLRIWKYDDAYHPIDTFDIEGTDAQLFAVSEGLLAVTKQYDRTVMTLYGKDLTPIYQQTNYRISLPTISSPNQYVDDFSNPASGWATYEDDQVAYGYQDGAYFIRSKQAGYLYAAFSPFSRAENYELEVDMNYIRPGDEYGVILDVIGNSDRFITFGLSKVNNRMYAHQFDGNVFRRAYENYAFVPHIWIKVIRDQYSLTVEDNYSFDLMSSMYFDLYPYVSRVGFYIIPRNDQPISEARFDNFVFRPQPGAIAPAYKPLNTLNILQENADAGDVVILPLSSFERTGNGTK